MSVRGYPCPGCGGEAVIKKGYFYTKWNGFQPVPRYQCIGCGRGFSSHTFRATYRQKKPALNRRVKNLYSSGMTQRRMALVEGVNRKTIVRKFLFLALHARRTHQQKLACGELRATVFQFDEMESFEHTRLKPLSLPIAVTASGKIIDIQVSSMPYRGRLAELARRKYGHRPDHRRKTALKVFQSIAGCVTPGSKILTDSKPAYRAWIPAGLPNFTHQTVQPKPQPNPARRANLDDPLFQLNHIAAKIRHDLSRMARKVWTTTKKIERLQAHLDLYIAFNNQYELAI